jgi:PhzF family phenazine biosynthesis protein
MKLTLYQVDAFTNKLFGGNPAAVIPLKKWLPDELMQQIALENNLSETVFFVKAKHSSPEGGNQSRQKGGRKLGTKFGEGAADYDIRWFTPAVEINLCGHATLASSFVLFDILKEKKKKIVFSSKSGLLVVRKTKEGLMMDFPSWKPERVNDYPAGLSAMLGGKEIVGVYKHRDWLVELHNEEAIKNCVPDFSLMKKHQVDKLIITAAGKEVDFVSRFFAPGAGVDEDPVTGSAHSQLIPFWSEKLGKKIMQAKQLSARGGDIYCEQLSEERVLMGGECVFYMKGEIKIA